MDVFVLGAGASKPYGYPTGYELRTEILKFSFKIDSNSTGKYTSYLNIPPLELNNHLELFQDTFKKSPFNSIDQFLTNNKGFDKIGRLVITEILNRCETKSNVQDLTDENNHKKLGDREHENWMSYFFNNFFSKIIGDKGLESLTNNNINFKFITFNYDRSLEYYLYSGIYNMYSEVFKNSKNESLFEKIISKFKIHHMYGWLDSLNYKENTIIDKYKYQDIKSADLIHISQNIHIIHSEERKKCLQPTRELIQKADTIVFLGFGYDEYNIFNLLEGSPLISTYPKVCGTVFRMTESEINTKQKLLNGFFGNRVSLCPAHANFDCKEFLRHNTDLLPIL